MAVSVKGRLALGGAVLVALGLGWWWYQSRLEARELYGDVEIREVDLAFNAEGRVASMPEQEGDKVKAGQLIATLDDGTYASALALARAQQGEAKAKLDLLLAGSRFEEIDKARAELESAQAQLENAQISYKRQAGLAGKGATPQQALDDAKAALDTAQAAVNGAKAQLTELVNGPRPEEIAAARAAYAQASAQVALAQTEENNTRLYAPVDGVIMTRVVEPGTVVLPSSVIYALANTSETWVRAFVPETMLGDVAPGTKVTITEDTPGSKTYHGVIGYVSPEAEFTPKTVETPDLRTQLVYRFRVRVTDADDGLRQGMPVTITLPGL
ncbi:HlyD family efflux transporter periplasmic adaptor subunit [Acidocella sp.]|uniref:HlyD family efflux transporter periplasmic adaptor subunit n=1 Tax=Acidocella sp. TaxID=50710 RepID=UPI00262972C0|nr:HlyD family efflux transporter periplasmic adaptor subunit [Acidocella sp.]